jgi:hypothetical protein
MGREAHSKVIGDTTYTVNQFGATKGNKILFSLKRFLGGALLELMSIDPKKRESSETVAKLANALGSLGEGMTEDEYDAFCKRLLSECFIGTTKVVDVMDAHFMGRLEEMYVLMAEAVVHNYSGFLKGLTALKAQAAVKASGSTSLNT